MKDAMQTDMAGDSHPLSPTKQRKHDAIIAAALEVFDRDGFEAARMIDIAREAGVAKGTLYLYFETKEDLLEGLINAVVVPTVHSFQSAASDLADTSAERLQRQLKILSQQLSKGEMLVVMKLMVANGPQRERLRSFYFENVVAPNMAAIDKTIRDGIESGEFKPTGNELNDNMLLASPFVMAAFWKILFQDISALDDEALFSSTWTMAVRMLGIER